MPLISMALSIFEQKCSYFSSLFLENIIKEEFDGQDYLDLKYYI
jgi:hypothetical protein